MGYGDFADLPRRTASNNLLRDQHLILLIQSFLVVLLHMHGKNP